MDKPIIAVVIMTRSTPLADGLHALLNAIPEIDEVDIARDLEHALRLVETRMPKIVMLDLSMGGENPGAWLEKMNRLSPETQRVLLVDDVQQASNARRYADEILIKGSAPSSVAAIVIDLLSRIGE